MNNKSILNSVAISIHQKMNVTEVSFASKDSDTQLYGHVWSSGMETSRACIFVHPWGVLGGSCANTIPFARKLALEYGMTCITFNLRGVGRSQGSSTYKCHDEVNDVLGACHFALSTLRKDTLVLIGSSAGAAIAGSAIDELPQIEAYVGIGYTFGWMSSFVFGGHFDAISRSLKPKLFIMGDKDAFTTTKQLSDRVSTMTNASTAIVPGSGHFDLENDSKVVEVCSIVWKFMQTTIEAK
jgi:uncharacterized protein